MRCRYTWFKKYYYLKYRSVASWDVTVYHFYLKKPYYIFFCK